MDCRVGDDWLVDSLIRYENIWMYGLQDSSKCLSWMSDKELLVASFHGGDSGRKNEIVELVVGDTLLASTIQHQDKQMAGARRDFSVQRGHFTKEPVHHMATFPHLRTFVTSGCPSGGVNVWTAEEKKPTADQCPGKSSLCVSQSGVPLLSSAPSSTRLLVSRTDGDSVVVDVTTGQQTWSQDSSRTKQVGGGGELLSSLGWTDSDHTFFTCQLRSGLVSTVDTRQKSGCALSIVPAPCCSNQPSSASDNAVTGNDAALAEQHCGMAGSQSSAADIADTPPSSATCAEMHRKHGATCTGSDRGLIASCCGCGCVQVSDMRQTKHQQPLALHDLSPCLIRLNQQAAGHETMDGWEHSTGTAARVHCTTDHRTSNIQLQFSPTAPDLLSVSGLDSGVHVLSVKQLCSQASQTQSGSSTTPSSSTSVFTHDGHLANADLESVSPSSPLVVLQHSWHPTEKNLLFSAASDGSLHAWQPRLPEGMCSS
eukprot:scpid27650/ scgid9489/ WD repeat-containing protein 73